jgi:PAS domain S-box-containing protein
MLRALTSDAAPDDPGVTHDLQVEATQRLMEALVESENRMTRRVQILSEIVFEIDAQQRLVFLNEAWAAITGYAVATSLNQPLTDFVLAGDRAALGDLITGRVEKSRDNFRHYRFVRVDRREIWVEVSVRPLGEGGGVGVLRDVTERRAQDSERLRVQRLQSIGTLAGGIAHDLNNALAPILMGLDLMRVRYPDQAGLLDPMLASAEHGAAMVRQVLTFARGVETHRAPVIPLRLLDDIAKILRSSFPRNIAIATHCARGLPRLVGDFTQLHQVLLNLCVNARDAMPLGGQLRIEAQVAEVVPGRDGAPADAQARQHLVFSVSDTGSGIPPEVVERMFEPFFSTKAPDKGTGLGLSTVLGIVRNHGGFITVDTTLGSGTAFHVFVPAADGTGHPEAPVLRTGTAGTKRPSLSVLFVDDDTAVREIARATLADLGHRVLVAANGAVALEVVRSRAALDAIVTDLDMPEVSGLELTRAARSLRPELPVIVCSGRMAEEEVQQLRLCGVTQFLAKPFSREKLAAALEAGVAATGTAKEAS